LEFSEVVQRRRMVRHCSSRLLAPEANGQAVAGGAVTALRRARMRRERVTSPAKQMRFGRTLGASPGQRTTAGTDNESRAC
jgi:hypothetical protein